MEQTLAIARAVVLIGAVAFAFLLGISGFIVVLREYKRAGSWPKMRELIELTNDTALKADVAKGTLGLSRMRPGLVMIVVGAALMALCLLRPYESTSETAAVTSVPRLVEPPKVDFQPGPLATIGPDEIAAVVHRQLEAWLQMAPDLEGKTLADQMALLEDRTGRSYPSRLVAIADRTMTVAELAEELFGEPEFAPLVRAFNPQLPNDGSSVPEGTKVVVLKPLLDLGQTFSITKKTLKVSAFDRVETYRQVLLPPAEHALADPAYATDPVGFWQRSGKSALELAEGLQGISGRQWAYRMHTVEEGESLEIVAKIVYGSREFAPILRFLNPQMDSILRDSKAVLPNGTVLDTVVLVDVP